MEEFGLTETLVFLIICIFAFYSGFKHGQYLAEQWAMADFMATWGLDGGGDCEEVIHIDEAENLVEVFDDWGVIEGVGDMG